MSASNGQVLTGTEPGARPVTDPADLWPADAYERISRDPADGLSLLLLLLKSSHWVHRRCESVILHDDRTVARRVSVDFTVPPLAPVMVLNGAPPVRLIPLTLLRKKTLVNFDLRDHAGAALPLLGLRQTQAITETMLTGWADIVLGRRPGQPDERERFGEYIRAIAAGTQEQLDLATEALTRQDRARGPGEAIWRRLNDDPRFAVVADSMADNFILMVALREEVGSRRIVKFSYDEPLSLQYKLATHGSHAHGRKRLPSALGLHPARIRFPTPAAENCQSYHFEVEAPAGVRIVDATMIAGRPYEEVPPSFDHVSGGFPRANLHVAGVPNGSVSQAQIQLTVAREGWLSTAAIACCATAVVLGMATWSAFSTTLKATPSAAPSALLAVIGGVGSLLVKPQEHRMTTRMLSLIRSVTVVVTALPFLATGFLVFAPKWRGTNWVLLVLAVIAAGLAALVAAAWFRAGRGRNVISPWEQGRNVQDLGAAGATSYDTYAEAEQANGYARPASIVASSEGEHRNLEQGRWNTPMELSMEETLEEAVRTLRASAPPTLLRY